MEIQSLDGATLVLETERSSEPWHLVLAIKRGNESVQTARLDLRLWATLTAFPAFDPVE